LIFGRLEELVTEKLGGRGVWSSELRSGDAAQIVGAASELEALGYSALWVPDVGGPLFEDLNRLLQATTTVTIATGILNIWRHDPNDVARWFHALPEDHRRRLLLGIGVSHGVVVGEKWGRPLTTVTTYLDGLELAGVPLQQVCLAALGPKMLELAKNRTAGAHPYLVTPEHTAIARAALGEGLLAVEQGVMLDNDPVAAREIGRAVVKGYGGLPNYANNWKRLGFTNDDISSGSDRLVDALIALDDVADIEQRIEAHRRAGADHVCIQVINAPGSPLPLDAWRRLSPL
jgi:probable F420-dependent oxidoreductase